MITWEESQVSWVLTPTFNHKKASNSKVTIVCIPVSHQSKEHNNSSTLFPISSIKVSKAHWDSSMCFQEHGQVTDIKPWFTARNSNRICCKENISRWFWIPTTKKEITEKPICIWQKIEFWVWVSTASKTEDSIFSMSQMPSPIQIPWNRMSNWWFREEDGSTQVISPFSTSSETTITMPWNPVTTSWENTSCSQFPCSSLSSPLSTAISSPLSTFSLSIQQLCSQDQVTSFNMQHKCWL